LPSSKALARIAKFALSMFVRRLTTDTANFLNPEDSLVKFGYAKSDYYIDKTGLLSFLNARLCKENRCIFVSRPRGFGKSIAANMVAAYYAKGMDSRSLFTDLAISKDASFEEHLNKYNVISFNVKHLYLSDAQTLVRTINDGISLELRKSFAHLDFPKDMLEVNSVLRHAFHKTKVPFVLVIDEWDCVLRECKDSLSHDAYLSFLNRLLRDEAYVALAYMTGILPVKKSSSETGLTMFREYSMTQPRQLAEYAGFTEEEAKKACESRNMDFEEVNAWH
jgi:hypothetical protein